MKHPVNNKELKGYEISFFGEKINVYVAPCMYANALLALEVFAYDLDAEDYEPFGMLTTNLNHSLQSEKYAFVKNYSENAEWAEELAKKLGRDTGIKILCSFSALPLYEFDIKKCYADG